jgi:hypothetical protein
MTDRAKDAKVRPSDEDLKQRNPPRPSGTDPPHTRPDLKPPEPPEIIDEDEENKRRLRERP